MKGKKQLFYWDSQAFLAVFNRAEGTDTPQGFEVRAGSRGQSPRCRPVKTSGDNYVFSQNYLFSSPSTAADGAG
jgi:hypothetical protein